MKIKDGFMLRQVGDVNVVVAVGEASENFNGLITLNKSGVILWNALCKDVSIDDLKNLLLDTYDIDEETAVRDIESFLFRAKEADLIE